ncbi:MAG TPA: hypothetical protein VMV18_14290 [bacterium]|nr:hypothetical protein [bacterium]
MVGLVSLCGGGVRLLDPSGGLDAATAVDALSSGAVRAAFYVSLAIWIVLSALAIATGGALVASQRIGRRLGVIYAWGSIATAMIMAIFYAAKIVPALTTQSLAANDLLRVAAVAPETGCCPTAWAVLLLAVLYNDAIIAWARPVSLPKS